MSRTEAPSSPDLHTFGLGGARPDSVVRVSPADFKIVPKASRHRRAFLSDFFLKQSPSIDNQNWRMQQILETEMPLHC